MTTTSVHLVLLLAAILRLVSCFQGASIQLPTSASVSELHRASMASFRLTKLPIRRRGHHDMTMSFGAPGILSTLRGGAGKLPPPKETLLVGKIGKALHMVIKRSGTACGKVEAAFRIGDLAAMAFLAFGTHLIFSVFYNQILNKTLWRNHPRDFEVSKTCLAGKLFCQIGQLALWVYAGEEFIIFLSALGVPRLENSPQLFGSCVYAAWTATKLSHLKNSLLDRAIARYPNARKLSARKLIYTRFLDAVIYLIGTLLFLDANNIDIGVAFASLITLGGVSSVVIGLALKSPMEDIIQGTSLLLADKFRPGDTIRLGDGTAGSVTDIRWTDTQIRGLDDSFVRIPHSQLAKTRVVNLSRTNRSQVKQEITLPIKQISKVEKLIHDIKSEIRQACPELIQDGALPFRVHWTDYNRDNIVLTVDCNFRIKRVSEAYWANRQNVLMAIARAIKKNE